MNSVFTSKSVMSIIHRVYFINNMTFELWLIDFVNFESLQFFDFINGLFEFVF
jgi:hypothetical protein